MLFVLPCLWRNNIVADQIKGDTIFDNSQLDDFILRRSDGGPTYNFVVVCDDFDMGVTHVIRGDDHLNNTPKQVNLYKALGADVPEFAHLPLILGQDGKRLSKRHGATAVGSYQDMGIIKEALFNYLTRLGWAHDDEEVLMHNVPFLCLILPESPNQEPNGTWKNYCGSTNSGS